MSLLLILNYARWIETNAKVFYCRLRASAPQDSDGEDIECPSGSADIDSRVAAYDMFLSIGVKIECRTIA